MKNKLLFMALFLIIGCDNKLSWIKKPLVIAPIVYGLSPEEGTVGTEVTISGNNFGSTPADNIVKINKTTATVIEANASKVVFIAPDEKTGPVEIIVNNQPAENKPIFTYK